MEFFEEISAPGQDLAALQKQLRIRNLPDLCHSISTILVDNQSSGRIYCLWGEFDVNRENIKHGVRFSLPGCPNALAWTITSANNLITVHCTINRKTHDEDFIASIYIFMADWVSGLKKLSS